MHDASSRIPADLGALEEPACSAAVDLTVVERLRAYYELGKVRLSAMAVLAVAVGYLAAGGAVGPELAALLAGAGLISMGSAFLNQFQEAELDARMARTRGRPLPSGRISELEALTTGIFLAMVGCTLVQSAVHPAATVTGLAILLGYNLAYTPLKRVSEINTFVGAVVGALPVIMGFVAVAGDVGDFGLILFSILFLWQLPHFWAIAWLYRDDYRAGGFHMVSRDDTTGHVTGVSALVGALLLVPVSLLPAALRFAGAAYFGGALVLGAALLLLSLQFARRPSDATARRLFRASLVYLPALFLLMLVDKVGH